MPVSQIKIPTVKTDLSTLAKIKNTITTRITELIYAKPNKALSPDSFSESAKDCQSGNSATEAQAPAFEKNPINLTHLA